MVKQRLLVLGVGNPIPNFIRRRVLAIRETHEYDLMMTVEFGQSVDSFEGVKIIRIGGPTSFFQKLMLLTGVLISPLGFIRLALFHSGLGVIQRTKLAIKYLPLTRVPRPDIIHIQWLSSAIEFSWLRRYFRCPIVGSVRGSQVTVYPLTRTNFKDVIVRSFKLVDACHLVSRDLMASCLALGAKKEKLFVNFNGINLQKFRPPINRVVSKELNVISVGSLMWRKGFVFQLMILYRLRERGINLTLTLVGSGPDLEGLKYLSHVLGLDGFINFKGQLTEDEIIRELRIADIYISTSLAEGLPNSLVEAAACGLPIVAFDCEGAREIIETDVTGFIVPPGDIDKAVECLFVLQNWNYRTNMGNRARERMEQNFDQEKCVHEMMGYYRKIIEDFA